MPTGYTAELMEKGQTFEQFVWSCARAMGALVMMRDDPSDATIPEKFEPSDWYKKELVKARKELARLEKMKDALASIRSGFGRRVKQRDLRQHTGYIEKCRAENKILEDMEKQVRAWDPPTDHVGLKEFMLEQLNTSKNCMDWSESQAEEVRQKDPETLYEEALVEAKRNVQYHIDEDKKEIERTDGRNKWLAVLRESLKVHLAAKK